jgi:hypothetical protein
MAGGRPLLFKTVEELEKKIDAYFTECEVKNRPYTISGLAYSLDIDRKTVLNYSNREEFFPTISRAKQRCEVYASECLFTNKSVNGVIFNMTNNYDYTSKKEVTMDLTAHTGKLDELIEQSK